MGLLSRVRGQRTWSLAFSCRRHLSDQATRGQRGVRSVSVNDSHLSDQTTGNTRLKTRLQRVLFIMANTDS
uniref:Uncharacterized protein n=1 Tax=Knipowitschia caucasica TaxID=637954 RepID=A0AAV2L236_KNICA